MESKNTITTRTMNLIANRRIRAFAIGVIILAVLAVLQVNNLKRDVPMCELLTNSKLSSNDIQRIQIALSQSGLGEYQLKDGSLLVPSARHSEYLHAVADQNAIPEELRDTDENSRPSVNPFLSRSQQLSIERAEKKHQIRDMVLRLPFVEQAWFEMDKSASHSAFEPAEQSAVISIRTPKNVTLSDQDVDTVKRMIGGAVAGMSPSKIVVIDLSAGFAHQAAADPSTSQQVHYRRIAFEQQRFYENQIRDLLKDYPGISVSVYVDVKPAPQNKTAAIPTPRPIFQAQQPVELPLAGANTYASIEPAQATVGLLVSHTTVVEPNFDLALDTMPEQLEKKISVSIDVPQKLVHQLFGAPTLSANLSSARVDAHSVMLADTQAKFDKLQKEIIAKILPVLPKSSFLTATGSPIAVNLIREPIADSVDWPSQLESYAIQNWPSAAVLLIGLMLLSIVTRKPEQLTSPSDTLERDDIDIVSINSRAANETGSSAESEVRLTKLIEKDPDAAAKVIEAWIRDAA